MKRTSTLRSAAGTAALLTALLTWVAARPAPAATPIQPGAFMAAGGGCTMNFVFDGIGGLAGSKVYVGTAGHCVSAVGDPVIDGDGAVWGRVAFIGGTSLEAESDFAFIEVLSEHLFRVDPSMKGHPGYPTGVTSFNETTLGDLLQFSGYGSLVEYTAFTREQRIGILTDDYPTLYGSLDAALPGDSGGPVVHIPTGKALGIVSQVCAPLCGSLSPSIGPTVQGMIDQAAEAGFFVALRAVAG